MDNSTCARGATCLGAGWLATYQPRYLGPLTWEAVRPFVTSCAQQLGLEGARSEQRLIRVLAWAGAWALNEGLALDPEVVLDPANVERFITTQLGPGATWATYRSDLRRVGPLLTRRAPWEPGPPAVAKRKVAVPYAPAELEALRADALAQPTPGRARAARAILALGAGAGLDGRWAAGVRATDVTEKDGTVLVWAAEPSARWVPVLSRWQAEVLDLAEGAGDQALVGGRSTSPNRAAALVASLAVGHGHPRFSLPRLRSTWLLAHLGMRTRLPELARAAGLQGVTVLSDLMGYLPPLGDDEALVMLRGGR